MIAAAGFGTRFLPQTKAMPKEMLPLVDKPIIQQIVEELAESGIEDIIIVTGYHKRSIEDHFDHISAELRQNLRASGKNELLEKTKKISDLANFIYIRQKGILGNATPLLNSEHLVGDEPFIYTFADDFFVADPPRFKQMIDLHMQTGSNVISCVQLNNDEDYKRYGVVGGDEISDRVIKMNNIVEKPGKENAPSNMGSVSSYLFNPNIFDYLKAAQSQVEDGKEFMIQPAMKKMIDDNFEYLALKIDGKWFDTGDKLEYIKTLIAMTLQRDDIKDQLRDYLKTML